MIFVLTKSWGFFFFLQKTSLVANQDLHYRRDIRTPRNFLPGMPVLQVVGNTSGWRQFPRCVFLGSKGLHGFILHSKGAIGGGGPAVLRVPIASLQSPECQLTEEFPDEVPSSAQPFLDPNLQGHYGR